MKQRQKKCRHCREWFQPRTTLDRACSPKCALELVHQDKERAKRREIKERREKLKTKGDHTREAQAAFNGFIRERDRDKPCISCGVVNVDHTRGGGWDCGHYLSTGANPELRFNELNAAKQCKRCNSHLSGNVANFRIGLRQRIGDDALEWLEGPHDPARYTVDDLKEIKAYYRKRTRELQRE